MAAEQKEHNANEPFTIFLDNNNYSLTEEALQQQVEDEMIRRKAWQYASMRFISLQNGVMKIYNTNSDITYTMTLMIEPDKLHVSCNCGMQVATICIHSYRALIQFCRSSWRKYFEDYRPNGLVETAFANKGYFDITDKLTDLGISPKEELGYVYPLSGELYGSDFKQTIEWAKAIAASPTPAPKLAELTYFIIHPYQNRLLPFIVPCLGILNKAATGIKGFYPFLSGTEKEYEPLLSETQRILNTLSYELWQKAEKLPGLIMEMDGEQKTILNELFVYWKRIWPLLLLQPFLFGYLLYGIKNLKAKPARRKLWPVQVSADKPQLQFMLRDKGPFYQLEMRVMVQWRSVELMESPTFMIRTKQYLYLLNNLQDAVMAEWMLQAGNCITVFKTDLEQFEKDILNPLREYYPVRIITRKIKSAK